MELPLRRDWGPPTIRTTDNEGSQYSSANGEQPIENLVNVHNDVVIQKPTQKKKRRHVTRSWCPVYIKTKSIKAVKLKTRKSGPQSRSFHWAIWGPAPVVVTDFAPDLFFFPFPFPFGKRKGGVIISLNAWPRILCPFNCDHYFYNFIFSKYSSTSLIYEKAVSQKIKAIKTSQSWVMQHYYYVTN